VSPIDHASTLDPMSNDLASRHADNVELLRDNDPTAVWSLNLTDCLPAQRRALIDHHAAVAALLRKRGHRIRSNIIHDIDRGELLTLRLATRGVTSVESRHGF
jgi:hypothetical protein